jgi:ubiquinone/menaquinone biosynthesis C-methylase UbiE
MTVLKDAEHTEPRTLRSFADFEGRRVLEIGCGDGRLTWGYARSARYALGIDLDRDELRIANIERPSDLEPSVGLAQADSIRLPAGTGAFDLAIFAWSF